MIEYKDKMGRYRTLSLFKETNVTPHIAPVFVLSEHDRNGLPSMRRLYLEIADPTEYKFAMEVLGSWDHWEKLYSAEWFKPIVAKWRRLLDMKLKSEAISAMRLVATQDGAKGTSAAKWLADNGYTEKKRGRPSEEEKQGFLKAILTDEAEVEDEFRRLGLEDETGVGQQNILN